MKDVAELSKNIRAYSLKMVHKSKASHIGSCLSCADILANLYSGWLRVDPKNPDWPDRDRFILSKGHAAAAIYATLALTGFFPLSWLDSYSCDDAKLGGHINHTSAPGVEVSSGSLGHGLPIGVGMALGAKREQKKYRVVVLLSDGECDEGSNWEALLLGSTHNLDNLLVIIDYNKLQAYGRVNEVALLEPFAEKLRAFNCSVKEIDGHDHLSLANTLSLFPFEENKISIILAHTVKGNGISFMEDSLPWHYKSPSDEQLAAALAELED